MLKKSLSAALSAALIVATAPFAAVQAAAAGFQAAPRLSAAPAVRLDTTIPSLPSGVAGLPGALSSVGLTALPSAALPGVALPAAAPAAPAAAAAAAAPAVPVRAGSHA